MAEVNIDYLRSLYLAPTGQLGQQTILAAADEIESLRAQLAVWKLSSEAWQKKTADIAKVAQSSDAMLADVRAALTTGLEATAELITLQDQRDAVLQLCRRTNHTVNLGSERHPHYLVAVLVRDVLDALGAQEKAE